ncbi:MAG: CoA ester lyase [Zoogloeaceae bacterium]|nr:CoA ester lyase [Zoogloeaceae bacterium]
MRSPHDVLFASGKPLPLLPVVDHYAGSEKLMDKALALQQELGAVFDITLDCEDGAGVGAEAEHARLCAAKIMGAENCFGRVGARIHDLTHPHWENDLEILVGQAGRRLAYLTLPKAESAADVARFLHVLRQTEAIHHLQRSLPVHVLIETPGALREVWQIAAQEGVESLDFGLMDFVSGHHGAIPGAAMKSPGQFTHPLIARAKCEIAAAALASGVLPTHNVTTELQDVAHIQEDARRARLEFGFLRMWSIHPRQILPILEALRPDFSEVEIAVELLVAAQEKDWSPIQYAGKLHDRASYRYYWELLQRAHATGMNLPKAVRQRFFAG